jgi:hypothetical protein
MKQSYEYIVLDPGGLSSGAVYWLARQDTLPAHFLGCTRLTVLKAGHTLKSASLIGQILSELAINGATPFEIAPFEFGRSILT